MRNGLRRYHCEICGEEIDFDPDDEVLLCGSYECAQEMARLSGEPCSEPCSEDDDDWQHCT